MNYPHIPSQYTSQPKPEEEAPAAVRTFVSVGKGILVLLAVLALVFAVIALWPARQAVAPAEDVPAAGEEADAAVSSSPQSAPRPQATAPAAGASQAGARFLENGIYVSVVEYTSQGFVPAELTIAAGEEVRFVNKSNLAMRVVADSTKSNQYYGSLKQPTSVGTGGVFQLGFSQSGLFTYYDLTSNPRKTGVIRVK